MVHSYEALGRYWVQGYWEGQKIAEATFETVPVTDPYSIRGLVTDAEGQPLEGITVWLKKGGEEFWVQPGPDGTFEVVVPSRSFTLEVWVIVESSNTFVGWYDGSGGITKERNQAFEVIVAGADADGVKITLPKEFQCLPSPSGAHHSTVTGRCP